MAKQSLKVNCSGSRCGLGEDVYSWSMQRITVVMTVLCVVFLLSPTVRAEDPFSTGPYPVGWYSVMGASYAVDIYYGGGNTILAYWGTNSHFGRDQFLREAEAGGMRVIVGIDEAFINPVFPVDVPGIIDLVNTYKDYSAVAGWYTADEPWYVQGISLAKMQTAYDAIKTVDTKPVFIAFSEPGVAAGKPVEWKNAYDHFLIDSYPGRVGYPEFTGLDAEPPESNYPYHDNWKLDMQNAQEQSILADRPWWSIMEGWGGYEGETTTYRLPTYNETRFMNYYSLSKDPTGLLHFVYYRNKITVEHPGEAYPYDGPTWFDEVWTQQAAEINALGPSLLNGKIAGAVSDDTADVSADVYYDPDTGTYYLLTLNETTGSETTTFTLTLADPPGEKFISADLLFEGAQPVIPIIGDQFSDDFSQYEVHVYELTTMLLGDANGSGAVSADDYGSVQGNFGDTGVPGFPGDANGSGAVSADDYGSVQANFGNTAGMGGAPVPEPATLSLLAFGGLAMLKGRRKQVS